MSPYSPKKQGPHNGKESKYLIEQQDLVLLLAALINPSVAIDTNYRVRIHL